MSRVKLFQLGKNIYRMLTSYLMIKNKASMTPPLCLFSILLGVLANAEKEEKE